MSEQLELPEGRTKVVYKPILLAMEVAACLRCGIDSVLDHVRKRCVNCGHVFTGVED